MEEENSHIKPEDFVLRIRPFTDAKGSWNGEIDISIITSPDNDLQDHDYHQIMHFCKMVASTVPIMEYNEDIRDEVHDYVLQYVDNDIDIVQEDEQKPLKKVTEDGNVIKIDFSTKTEGSA